jgi:hypothetical protein
VISGTSVVYFVETNAYVTLPPATTAGQQIILYNSTLSPNGSNTYNVGPPSSPAGTTIIDGVTDNNFSSGNYDNVYDEGQFLSDGNGHWFVLNRD